MNMLNTTIYWAIIVSLSSYFGAKYLQDKTRCILFNPLLFSTVFTILFLIIFKIDYDSYCEKISILNYLLTPATVCLAVPLYEQINILKKNILAIILSISSGMLACAISILGFSKMFGFSKEMFITLLPKSVTAAMAMGISEELGGIASLTVPIVIMTGITGNIIASVVCRLFHISDPISRGLAIGSSSHAMGTAKAMEIGKIEGAMSSLAMAVSGVIMVFVASLFSVIY